MVTPTATLLIKKTITLAPALNQVAEMHKNLKMTIILVSHSMEDVANYVERLIVMNRGQVMYDDEPREVFRHYEELEQMGLSAPQVTYVMRKMQEAGMQVSDNVSTIEEAKEEIKRYFSEYVKMCRRT